MIELQKSIYNCLISQDSENFKKLTGIFNYIDKNLDFPYIYFSVNNIENLSTFSKEIYSYSVSINTYDKNTTNSFVILTMEEIKKIFKNIPNFETDTLKIIDIKLKSSNLSLENNNTIWNGLLNFDFIISSEFLSV